MLIRIKFSVVFVFLLIAFFASSCAFNKAFFRPDNYSIKLVDTIEVENWVLRSQSGTLLSGRLYKPKEIPRATVFLLTGETGDMDDWYTITAIMVRRGFQVLAFDYRGFGISQGKASHKNILSDSQLFLDSLLKRSEIKNQELVIWGFSVGANLAVKLTSDNPQVFDFMILEAPFTSQRDFATRNVKFPGSLFAYPFATSPYASKKIIGSIHNTPLLVVHSVEDKNVPYKLGANLYELANKPKLFLEVLGPHNFALIDYETLYFEKIDKLFALKTAK